MEARTKNRRCSNLSCGGVSNTRKLPYFLVKRATEKQHVDPEDLVLSLTRLRDFLVEREVEELSLPVCDPKRGRLHPRELAVCIDTRNLL